MRASHCAWAGAMAIPVTAPSPPERLRHVWPSDSTGCAASWPTVRPMVNAPWGCAWSRAFAPGYTWVPLDNMPLGCKGHALLLARLAAIEDIERLGRQPL